MKKVLIAAMLLMAGLTQAQNVTVNTEKKPNTDFSKYKTYTWTSQVDNRLDPGFYFLNDLELKERIRNAVAFAMDGRGYKLNRQSPDLLINFRVFEKATKIKEFSDYGNNYFAANEIGTPDNMKMFDIKAGSIILNMVDKKTGQVVWQGIASGITNTNGFDRDHNKIKQAINLLFEQYTFRADAY